MTHTPGIQTTQLHKNSKTQLQKWGTCTQICWVTFATTHIPKPTPNNAHTNTHTVTPTHTHVHPPTQGLHAGKTHRQADRHIFTCRAATYCLFCEQAQEAEARPINTQANTPTPHRVEPTPKMEGNKRGTQPLLLMARVGGQLRDIWWNEFDFWSA